MSSILNSPHLTGCIERSYGEWTAHCPVCADGRRVLLIREHGDGRTTIHCMRGCPLPWILMSLGLSLDALFPSGAKHCAAEPGWWRRARRYAPLNSRRPNMEER